MSSLEHFRPDEGTMKKALAFSKMSDMYYHNCTKVILLDECYAEIRATKHGKAFSTKNPCRIDHRGL